MALAVAAERPVRSSQPAPRESLKASMVREHLTGRFLKNYNAIAVAVNDWNNRRARELAEKNGSARLLRTEISPKEVKRIVINEISRYGSVDLLAAEENLHSLFQQITAKEKAVDKMVEKHIPNAIRKLLVLYMYDGNKEQATRVAKRFGELNYLEKARTKAIDYNAKAERDGMTVDLICTKISVTYPANGSPLVSFIRRPLFEAARPYFSSLE
jgi:hypothetical protein